MLPDATFDTLSTFFAYAKNFPQSKEITPEIDQALTYLLSPSSRGRILRQGVKEYDLLDWYSNELRRHFVTNLRAVLGIV